MGSGPSVDTSNKEIVIVGGGYGGCYLAHKLTTGNVGKVTLVEPREGMFHSIGALRNSVDESYSNKLIVPFTTKIANCHVKSKASGLDAKNKTLTLENGDTIKFTDLVIACGTSSPFPGKLGLDNPVMSNEDILQKHDNLRKKIMEAKRIVLVGGGAVGVELAGEIKGDFPAKKVTVINSREFLVSNRAPPAFQKALTTAISKLKIEVLLNERVTNLDEVVNEDVEGERIVKTSGGKEITCDLVIPCTGTKINNDFYKEELADALNEAGALCVDEYLRVKGHDDIYAIGDVNDVPEEKMAYTAKLHADAVFSSLKGKPKKHGTAEFLMVVTLGRNGGVGLYKGMMLGNFMVKRAKSADMMAGDLWKGVGQKAPK